MSISIVTKFLGPTNCRGSRVAAQTSDYGSELERYSRTQGRAGRIVVDWDHRLNPDENHRRAAMALAVKLGWDGPWYGGDAPGSTGWIFVRSIGEPAFTVPPEEG